MRAPSCLCAPPAAVGTNLRCACCCVVSLEAQGRLEVTPAASRAQSAWGEGLIDAAFTRRRLLPGCQEGAGGHALGERSSLTLMERLARERSTEKAAEEAEAAAAELQQRSRAFSRPPPGG